MIGSKEDYLYFLEADRISLSKTRKRPKMVGDEIWKFQRLLRRLEYYSNCKKGPVNKVIRLAVSYLFTRKSLKLNFSIPKNVFDAGLNIAHYGTIVVNSNAKIGKNCRIHVGTNIGAAGGTSGAPVLGNNVYIGPGAKIFGGITLADDIAVGANAVVNKSFLTPGVSLGGVPAGVISSKGSHGLVVKGSEQAAGMRRETR